ncbi:hypothetical protein [Streptosporangium sp. NBC_01756]|uniref:hypothetical protein n=1 Tax=Streptosporangium sp. NBC_01756 TaxID=2975950 RepID=UPI002DDAEF0D|nr:hypothetical protein [Streptosporangium sp. NBC_01756]WSC90065.1 hypothetical protein OIE48_18355 [Streptosporangium sp. NBC_01756]
MTSPIEQMQQLVADLDAQHRREADAYAAGYRDGHRSGWEVGYSYACYEMARVWSAIRERVLAAARRPVRTEFKKEAA